MRSRATSQGETDAEIYNRHRDALIRYASALVGPSHAEDVVSTVVLRTLNRRSLASLDRADAYLFRAVLNESRSKMRRQQPVELPSEIGSFEDPDIDTTILEVVARLPAQQRAATYLVYWTDLSVAETAVMMGVREGTVKRYLHDARRNLRKALPEEIHDEI